jgi:TIR domain
VEIFDVFLCHNSEDKPAVREIAQKLSEENIKPWLDEADIRGGSFWRTAIGQQIETVKSAAVFVGDGGVGPWQSRENIALLDQFDRRGWPVIPVILASDQKTSPNTTTGLRAWRLTKLFG